MIRRNRAIALLLRRGQLDELERIGRMAKETFPLPKKRKRRRRPDIGDRLGSYERLVGQDDDSDP